MRLSRIMKKVYILLDIVTKKELVFRRILTKPQNGIKKQQIKAIHKPKHGYRRILIYNDVPFNL